MVTDNVRMPTSEWGHVHLEDEVVSLRRRFPSKLETLLSISSLDPVVQAQTLSNLVITTGGKRSFAVSVVPGHLFSNVVAGHEYLQMR